MNDPHAQGLLPEPFLEHGLLAAEYLHGQPVLGRFEDGHQTRQDARPDPPRTTALVAVVGAGGQAVRGGCAGGGGVRTAGAAAAGIARILREIRVGRRLHGGSRCRQLTRPQRRDIVVTRARRSPGTESAVIMDAERIVRRARHCGGQNETDNTRNVDNGTRRTDETVRGRRTYGGARARHNAACAVKRRAAAGFSGRLTAP